jgi:hypothetical protein
MLRKHRLGRKTAALLAIASCLWFGWDSFSQSAYESPTITATAFLNDVSTGRIEAAYARTSLGFQACHSPDSLRVLCDQFTPMRDAGVFDEKRGDILTVRPSANEAGSWLCKVWTKEGKLAVALKIITEQGQRKVSACVAITSPDFPHQSGQRHSIPSERRSGKCRRLTGPAHATACRRPRPGQRDPGCILGRKRR